ncbi:sugar transferase [Lichenicoccus sp.]|uniref:sugar transferase n=1 Tax=Lichenicoccus sp. TaxID=2781899 RepID=UPI003D10889F
MTMLAARGESERSGAAAIAKRATDIVVAILLIVIVSPVLLAIWIVVRADGGPALFRHERIGQGGARFACLKFRSMTLRSDAVLLRHLSENPQAQVEWAESRKLRHDPRVTGIGRVLRGYSLDELPQLVNVLRGEMSLVGPRPVVQSELDEFYGPEGKVCYLSVRPGLTGLWQVTGRSGTDYERRVALDTHYVRKMSAMSDAMILLRTVAVVFSQKGAY